VAEVVPLAAADVVALDEVCADDASVDVPESDPHAVTTPANKAAPSAMAAALEMVGCDCGVSEFIIKLPSRDQYVLTQRYRCTHEPTRIAWPPCTFQASVTANPHPGF